MVIASAIATTRILTDSCIFLRIHATANAVGYLLQFPVKILMVQYYWFLTEAYWNRNGETSPSRQFGDPYWHLLDKDNSGTAFHYRNESRNEDGIFDGIHAMQFLLLLLLLFAGGFCRVSADFNLLDLSWISLLALLIITWSTELFMASLGSGKVSLSFFTKSMNFEVSFTLFLKCC